jgi:uncharacterized membrane protein YoaK (UPF0700 family)
VRPFVTALVLHPTLVGNSRLVIIAILSCSMGIQNAVMRRWGVADIATTLMTLTYTAFLADLPFVGGGNKSGGRRLQSVFTFVLGGAIGSEMVRIAGPVTVIFVALVVLAIAMPLLTLGECYEPRARRRITPAVVVG